eukprot:gnl/MRDRNA2_/MRDRNA2_56897_c0_seq1.p1 gnl/MRDRNA2_/MRDRNA2_56897_c0~~gnl/MRDRNA2_/MRDRNA2_56897_c0_seq1.p1  ORF type:complete len:289 (-),score=21.78 gnl/MRDRNA2_/MRDRNA2_56897_c0_seq1:98-964(-)
MKKKKAMKAIIHRQFISNDKTQWKKSWCCADQTLTSAGPSWQHRFWSDSDVAALFAQSWVPTKWGDGYHALKGCKKYGAEMAHDYASNTILWAHGGVYIDMDVFVLKPLEPFFRQLGWSDATNMFGVSNVFGFATTRDWRSIEPAISFGTQGNPFLQKCNDWFADFILHAADTGTLCSSMRMRPFRFSSNAMLTHCVNSMAKGVPHLPDRNTKQEAYRQSAGENMGDIIHLPPMIASSPQCLKFEDDKSLKPKTCTAEACEPVIRNILSFTSKTEAIFAHMSTSSWNI